MTTYTGTQNVEPGLYWALKPFRFTSVDTRGPLPGTEARTWYRVPMLLMLALAPLLGLAFVVFLPFIAFVIVFRVVGEAAADRAKALAARGARAVRPAWAPARAFLTRARTAKPDEAPAEPDAWAEETERRISGTDDDRR